MPPKKRRGGNPQGSSPAADTAGDRLGALPDDVLHHVLSFLPAEEAVQTCVLARRWRDLWKSATGLRITRENLDGPESVTVVRDLVDHVLLLRGGAPLDTCEISLADLGDDDMPRVKLWIRHILMCKVRVLSLDILKNGEYAELDGLTLISGHLKKLQLSNIQLDDKLLDFSCCPALEVLEIADCELSGAEKISLPFVRCLSITSECCFDDSSRIFIDAPNLRSLRLEIGNQRTPVLGRMPSLVEAFVNLCDSNCDCCDGSYSGDCGDEDCFPCYEVDDDIDNCVLLQGLSEAQNLTLKADVDIFIFRRDLNWNPIFGNLKSLLLNEYWCMPADFSALAYMLEHSPVLEKLTLQLFSEGPKSKVEMKGIPDPIERSTAMSQHLKIVEVKCEVVDDRVLEVLKFLNKHGIHLHQWKAATKDDA